MYSVHKIRDVVINLISFILVFRLVRKLVFSINVYLKEIPCLNKVTIPYHTIPDTS